MNRFIILVVVVLALSCGGFSLPLQARDWFIVSPDHAQTFAFGTETKRAWAQLAPNQHLGLYLNFTNDPYVDRDNPRRYDNFLFNFPAVRLGGDGRTFFYHTPEGRLVPVARKRPDLFGFDEIKLLPNAELLVHSPHGYLTLTLVVRPMPAGG